MQILRIGSFAAILLASSIEASLDIVSGATWTAAGTDQHIQAHGAGIIEVDGTYYLIGENKLDGTYFQSVNCYSSKDLIEWEFVNELLSVQESGDLGPQRIVERPKVIYNDDTEQYVMWMHIDSSDYGDAKAGVATGSSVCGDYTYINSTRPLGYVSRDLGLFKDTDGTAYLLTEDRDNGLRIDLLSADYLTVESPVHLFETYESPAIYKSGDTYFMFGSQLTGWDANDNRYTTATNLSGPWSEWTNFAPEGSKTFTSQSTYILEKDGVVIYMGDRWVPGNLASSTYVWLPLTISGTKATLNDASAWKFTDGSWETAEPVTTLPAVSDDTTLGGSARTVTDERVGYLGGPDNGTLTFSSVSASGSGKHTVQITYRNGDGSQRYCAVVVNDKSYKVAFSSTGTSVGTSIVHAEFADGDENEIRFEGLDGKYCPDIQELVIS
ncbi:glycosyl hydrolase family 43 protein [Aspergillus steynii IBT 23096]|uniref:Glycosyl hydrolase family 43 protein n=1 Tax=Aspergillus steynii IBT 23096 TaxID=1392250 RepID=A0A2I2GM45_9EURO|nr:glycosyl hydrolase family 43 protein [Aspergillus steynii IBT 23096]PLB53953.1 glycosyl hydrolase family 43 protein [Aspergillus steynii IBT 23096]